MGHRRTTSPNFFFMAVSPDKWLKFGIYPTKKIFSHDRAKNGLTSIWYQKVIIKKEIFFDTVRKRGSGFCLLSFLSAHCWITAIAKFGDAASPDADKRDLSLLTRVWLNIPDMWKEFCENLLLFRNCFFTSSVVSKNRFQKAQFGFFFIKIIKNYNSFNFILIFTALRILGRK